jgi:hypothetical protein
MIVQLLKPLILPGLFLLAAMAFAAWMKATRGRRGERAVHNAIVAAGAECITDFIIPDGRGGLTQVDHVVKLPIGIAVIETKNYSGKIYGTEREKTWTQAIGGQRNKFQNPLRQNHLHVEAIKAIVGECVDVIGPVIFVGDAKFRETPEGVSGLSALRKHLGMVKGMPVPPNVEAAWATLQASMRTDDGARADHLVLVRQKKAQQTV